MKVMSELEALTNPKAPQGKKSLTAKQQQDKQLIMNVMSGMRDESSAERYLNDPCNTKPEDLLTEIFIPVE